ncbi:hypothetical protein FRB95_002233 [Tulasnella sp. JGI-2019a]|nr:hypothetical protein FRB93_006001 [Tulasnella sp. JGI-2019a]KAG9038272.1 hypothetical protein FRB95_002233 [Tulasnella sp. JGI-2019a]
MQLTADYARFLAVWLEAILLGANVVLFVGCFWLLYSKTCDRKRPTIILCVLSLMMALNTAHMVGTLEAAERVFFAHESINGAAASYYDNLMQPLDLFGQSVRGIAIVLGDGLLIYRLWVVWQRKWTGIAAPIFLLAGTAITSYWLVFDDLRISSATTSTGTSSI